jgi:hypothetical protein
MNFNITDTEMKKVAIFILEQNAIALEKQRKEIKNPSALILANWEAGYPYAGAIGGSASYTFTPTSLGRQVVVKHAHTGAILDVTDYEDW